MITGVILQEYVRELTLENVKTKRADADNFTFIEKCDVADNFTCLTELQDSSFWHYNQEPIDKTRTSHGLTDQLNNW